MTSRELEKHTAALRKRFSDLHLVRNFMFAPVRENILRGLCFDSSSFSKTRFYVSAFSLPLCYPEQDVYLNFGFRLIADVSELWDTADSNVWINLERAIESQAMPFFERTETASSFATLAASMGFENFNTYKAIAFAYAGVGAWATAMSWIDEIMKHVDTSVAWQRNIADNSGLLRSKFIENPAIADMQLASWKKETLANLRLGSIGV